jgi:tRNA pseudouridine32 synthase/23S rRNA pseudouridine746 synthase
LLTILFENDEFVLIDKPEDVSFHSESGPGVVVQISEQLGIPLYSVHRLDKMTSGLLLLAKTTDAARSLTEMFTNRLIEKFYIAISTRMPKKKQGRVQGDMAASRRGSYKLLITKNNPAVTQFISTSIRPHERLFLIKPHTGKTHQIRVALKSLGSPIAGDERYAQADEARKEDRGYLHAYALRFIYNEKPYTFISPPASGVRFISDACKAQIQQWAEPWTQF